MPDSPEAIPWPGERPAQLPPLEPELLADTWRLHWEPDPILVRRYPTGRYRCDAPAGQFSVTYVNDDRLAVFAETYAQGSRLLAKSEADRLRSRLWSTRQLRRGSRRPRGRGSHVRRTRDVGFVRELSIADGDPATTTRSASCPTLLTSPTGP